VLRNVVFNQEPGLHTSRNGYGNTGRDQAMFECDGSSLVLAVSNDKSTSFAGFLTMLALALLSSGTALIGTLFRLQKMG
jgi:hypothetical protein